MSGDQKHLLRTALKALLAYAPAQCPTDSAPIPGTEHPPFNIPRYGAACAACRQLLRNDGQHAPDCRWMRARSVIGAIRSFQRDHR